MAEEKGRTASTKTGPPPRQYESPLSGYFGASLSYRHGRVRSKPMAPRTRPAAVNQRAGQRPPKSASTKPERGSRMAAIKRRSGTSGGFLFSLISLVSTQRSMFGGYSDRFPLRRTCSMHTKKSAIGVDTAGEVAPHVRGSDLVLPRARCRILLRRSVQAIFANGRAQSAYASTSA